MTPIHKTLQHSEDQKNRKKKLNDQSGNKNQGTRRKKNTIYY
jgi:hypothetical protein